MTSEPKAPMEEAVKEAVFFHPSYSHREFMEAVLRQAYRAMIEAASPTPQGEGRRS